MDKKFTQPHGIGVTNTLTLPDGNAELVSTVATQTLTNESLTAPTITVGNKWWLLVILLVT